MSNKSINLAFCLLVTSNILIADNNNMATSLMSLRAEVEQLDSQIDEAKDSYKASIKSLTLQKSELESMISREVLKTKQIQKELQLLKEKIAEASKNSKGLTPVINQAIDNLVLMIENSIPFKKEERIAAVQKIQEQLKASLITPQKALSYVYNSYADEIRMTKENGVFKQTITLDGKDKLVKVARIGTAMMFFQTPNDRVGYVLHSGTSWEYKEEFNKEKQDEISTIFDAFVKQIRSGYFTLPNVLVLNEVK